MSLPSSLRDGVYRFWTWSPLKTASLTCWVPAWIFPRQKDLRSQLPSEHRARPSLPFRAPTRSLRDILERIDLIVQFVRGMDLEAFSADPKTVSAVERKLLLISEAATRLGEDAERLFLAPEFVFSRSRDRLSRRARSSRARRAVTQRPPDREPSCVPLEKRHLVRP
jgi:hypothetical protein